MSAEAIRDALERLALKLAPPEEHPIWQCLIRSYSGLADLSLPSWFLCGLLTAPSGVLALVVPQTWLSRDYARITRYFFLRFFQPLAVVQESGQRWFHEALVPVSLVIGRRLPPEQTVTPLRGRRRTFSATPYVEIGSSAASEHSHVGRAFVGDDPEGEFSNWLARGSGSRAGVALKRVSWESQRDEALSVSQEIHWLRQLEGDPPGGIAATVSSSAALPPSVAPLVPMGFLNHTQPLTCEPIRVGQGLRTGCNAFFYVDLAGDVVGGDSLPVLTSELFGRRCIMVPPTALKPVLRRQAELSGLQVTPDALRGRLLDLRGLVLPEDAQRNGVSRQNRRRTMPESLAEYVRSAARTYLVRGQTRTLIPHLSAVKPNGLGPSEGGNSPSSHGGDAARMWYMIPDFAPRHIPSLCVPRIIHDAPRAILNAKPPLLVDANFSALWCEDDRWNPETVFAIFNSTWGELCMEALGVSLGGGALKLEATHLRRLPIPIFSGSAKGRLRSFARAALETASTAIGFRRHRAKIDRIVFSALARRQLSSGEINATVEKLTRIIRALRAKRRRNHHDEATEEE
ncbi:MAG: hypothetical protein HY600_07095 [Candidatus Omnitrophica bacterium]|nr:hypothetical protein [Candidatus Omnitrophota bacterium]